MGTWCGRTNVGRRDGVVRLLIMSQKLLNAKHTTRENIQVAPVSQQPAATPKGPPVVIGLLHLGDHRSRLGLTDRVVA